MALVRFFISLFVFINILSILYLVDFFLDVNLLKFIPITGRQNIMSWVWALFILTPFVIFLYYKYYVGNKFPNLIKEYETKSSRQLLLGRLFYLCYCALTWIAFFLIIHFFKH